MDVQDHAKAHACIYSGLESTNCDGVAAKVAANGVKGGAQRRVRGDGHNVDVR